MGATPTDDLGKFMKSISSCQMDGVGTFHIYTPIPTHYMLVHEKSATESKTHMNSMIFHCGKEVERFIPVDPTRLMIQFYDFPLVVTVVTKDNWKTFKEERYSKAMLPLYLKVRNGPYQTASRDGNTDMTIETEDGSTIPVHSSVLADRWPYFKSEMDKSPNSKTLKLADRSQWVNALVDLLYGKQDQLDLDTATGVLVLATKYKLPKLVELATRTIYAMDIGPAKSLATWREVRKYNEAVARYCATRIKTSADYVADNYAEKFQAFSVAASDEEKDAFMAHMAPKADIPIVGYLSS